MQVELGEIPKFSRKTRVIDPFDHGRIDQPQAD